MSLETLCVDCGGPRSSDSGQRCRVCYQWRAATRRLVAEARPMIDHLLALGAEVRAQRLQRAVVRMSRHPLA